MRARSFAVFTPFAFLVACSPASDATSGAGGSGGGMTTSGSLFQTHPPEKSKPANVVGGFSIQLPKQTLKPGEELEPCYIFPLEVTGPSRVVGGAKLTVGPGMHHGNIVTRPKTGEGFRPCDPNDQAGQFGGEATAILKGGAVLFASSTQVHGEEWQRFPDGMGYPIKDGFEIVASMHYLNTTDAPLDVAPLYEWFTVDEAKIDHLLGPFAWALNGWQIPPKSEFTASGTCKVLGPMHLVHVLPHMHRMGREFTGDLLGGDHDGLRFLDSVGYDPDGGVMLEYEPPLDLSVADQFRFSCKWQNTLDKTLTNGIGDNEMCILFGYAYPFENAYSALSSGGDSCVLASPPSP
jgi:hypothetical protein